MIVLIRSNDLLTENRLQKYIEFLKEKNIEYTLIGWNRQGKDEVLENTIYYKKKVGYNLRKKAIKTRIYWNFFILKELYKNRKKYKVIHACDFDTIMPSLFMKLFKKKVIFDIFDWFSDEVKTGNKLIDGIINLLEKKSFQISDYVIICEEERKKQIGVKRKQVLILPNIPSFKKEINFYDNKERKKITISYVGGFYKYRGLDELLEVVSENPKKLELKIAGFGDIELEKKIKEYSEKYLNIFYYGKVHYTCGLEIMKKSDLIYAMYYTANRNHLYAAPNKYYESLFLNKAILTNVGTIFSDKLLESEIGFVIGEGKSELENFLKELNKEKLIKDEQKLKDIWEKKYKNYVREFLDTEYLKIIEGNKK